MYKTEQPVVQHIAMLQLYPRMLDLAENPRQGQILTLSERQIRRKKTFAASTPARPTTARISGQYPGVNFIKLFLSVNAGKFGKVSSFVDILLSDSFIFASRVWANRKGAPGLIQNIRLALKQSAQRVEPILL